MRNEKKQASWELRVWAGKVVFGLVREEMGEVVVVANMVRNGGVNTLSANKKSQKTASNSNSSHKFFHPHPFHGLFSCRKRGIIHKSNVKRVARAIRRFILAGNGDLPCNESFA